MGFLIDATPLTWEESLPYLAYIREHGIQQFISTYNKVKARKNDVLLWAKALETAGSKGLTKAALSEAVFKSANKDILSKLKEGYEQQLAKMIAQAKLVVLDGNKVKLFRLLDERAVARFKAEAAERKKAAAAAEDPTSR